MQYRVKHFFTFLVFILFFSSQVMASKVRYVPVDFMTFVPISDLKISLGADKTLTEDSHEILTVDINHPNDVISYEWKEGSKVLGKGKTFSTANLTVGTHTITLSVIDDNGLKISDNIVIIIEERMDESDLDTSSAFVGTTKGEFSVNQGTANYSLLIDVPPGVSGMEPKLSLEYASSASNGVMGLGWNIGGVSAITRCPQSKAVDGVNHSFGVKYNSHDRFCLDGQRLISVSGAYGADGTEYRTEIDTYAKIISKGDYHGGPRYFDVRTKNGLRYFYGWDVDTYVHTTPGHAIKAWKVDRIFDTYNNKITFKYSANYTKGSHYLDKVLYADNSVEYEYEDRRDALTGYHEGYPFVIDKRLKRVIVKTGSTEVRRYNITYNRERTGTSRSKVTSITEHLPQEGDLKTLHFEWRNTYINGDFTYEENNPQSTEILANGQDTYGNNDNDNKWYTYTPDVNGDGLSDICYRSDEGIKCFINHQGTFDNTADIDTTICANSSYASTEGGCNSRDNWRTIRFADMNGDGLADILFRSDNGIRIYKSTGSGFTYLSGSSILQNDNDIYGNNDENNWKYIYTPDTNGDGLSDLCYRSDKGVKCYINYGSGFHNTATISTSICADHSKSDGTCDDIDNYDTIRFVDMDGDGLQDLFYRSDNGIRIWKSTGKGFSTVPYSSNIIKNIQVDPVHIPRLMREEYKYIYTPDMNGDGLADICYRSYEGIKCYTNRGGTFASTPTISTSICKNDDKSYGVCNDEDNYKTIQFLDTDGDGFVDLTYRSDAGMRIWKNHGNRFGGRPLESTILGNYQDEFGNNDYDNWSTKSYFDANGDGMQDLYYRSDAGIIIYNSLAKHSIVTSITNDTDQNIHIAYQKMTNKNVYHNYSVDGKRNSYAFNDIANGNIEVTLPKSLVYAVKSDNGVGGYTQIRYKYYGYVFNKLRGAQGFHGITTYNDTARMYSTEYYKQIGVKNGVDDAEGFQFTGMPYATNSSREFGVDTSLHKTFITYKDASKRVGVYEPYTSANVQKMYDPNTKAHIKSEYHENTLSTDGLGNILSTVDRIVDNVSSIESRKKTTNEYKAEDTNKWYIGRLTKAIVAHDTDGGALIQRFSTFEYNDKGVLSKEVTNAGNSLALTKTYTYDSHGNKASETISGEGIVTAKTEYAYGGLGKFQTSVTNVVGLKEIKTYDARFGTLKSLTGPNGLTTKMYYDGLGRKIKELRADGTVTTWSHTYGHNFIAAPNALYSVAVSTKGSPFSRTYYDSLGRDVGSYTYTMKKGSRTDYANRRIVKRKYYNAKGELTKEELPHYQNATAYSIETKYDNFGRALSVSKPGPSGTTQTYTTTYDNFTQTIADPKGILKRTVKNAFDQIVSVTDAYGSSVASGITYKYDSTGNLLLTTDANGNQITMAYDSVGNKIKMIDLDLGIWNYRYTALGTLRYQWSGSAGTTASKHFTTKTYDILGRVTREMSYNRAEHTTNSKTYSYNQTDYLYGSNSVSVGSKGKLLKTTSRSRLLGEDVKTQVIDTHYDSLGQPTESTTTIEGKEYKTLTRYDKQSRPSSLTYPNGYQITNHYKNGILDSVIGSDGKVHYSVNSMTAFGEISDAIFANGVRTAIGYDDAGYIGSMHSGKNNNWYTGNVQQLHYTYGSLGNVHTRVDDSISGKSIRDGFGYDAMNRMTSIRTSSTVSGTYSKAIDYRYDKIGNITYQSGLGGYTYYADKPHAVKTVGSRSYAYDVVGNMTNRNGDNIRYNPLNKAAKLTNHVNNKTVSFYYGAGDARYMKQTDEKFTYYLGKTYEEDVKAHETKQTCYIMLGGKTIGTHVEVKNTYYVPTNPHYNATTYNHYFHTDALGSISAITDDMGKVVERRSYEPFGKIRAMDYGTNSNTLANMLTHTNRAFTGHEQISEISGLIHMNARVYDSDIGRFLSADTLIQAPHDSQSYNRYAYARNNPMVFTDPSGHSWFSKHWKQIKNILIGVVVAVIVAATGVAALGAMGTSLAGASAGELAVAGAIGGFAGGVANGLLHGANLGQSIAMGVKGAAFGGLSAGAAGAIGTLGETIQGAWGATAAKSIKAALHGMSRAAINKAQGGKWSAGFWSGLASSALGGFIKARSFEGKIAMASIVGGTASVLGGGKFANGAVSAAFVHMYNAMSHVLYPSKEQMLDASNINEIGRAYRALSMMVRSNGFGVRGLPSLSYSQAYDRVLMIEVMNDNMSMVLIGGTALLTGEAALMAVGRFGVVAANGYEATLFTRGVTSPIPTLTTPTSWHELTGFVLRQVSGL